MSNPERKSYIPSQISAGDFPVVMEAVVIAAGQQLKSGSVLGQVTASKEYVLCKAAAQDGSQAPSVILDQDVDTTDGARSAPVRLTGQVLGSQLVLGEGLSLATVKVALRPLSLFIR
ncbi:head decoration protein [Pseudomonas gingeri]|uniref:head decoration protein n=1 Tax=Pseudomonas gingeri TaxID=117681 RepID=UPI0015A00B2C|nr:head decoration protein [Pseudomonas gingeri]NWA04800.1 head decoration protein [Pseudomonas gingeri]NWA17681.1 head decoration protein [Pseudomonas gingeri]NWA56911.1 head decoration protein [Pseudomonas gingeri]NWA97223.1 head decoration protein [Pseudomonas gingeri]NWB01725.1 head decoration protein [Pseudomonas gingeri]